MGDPYYRYGASSDRATYPGYTPPDASTLPSQHWQTSHTDLSSSSLLQNDILGASVGARPEPASNGYPSTYEDPYLVGRRDIINESGPGISSILNDRPDSLRKADVGRESNFLFVDALPSDCSRREVSHLFRPFPGFKEIRLVHKEPRHSTDKPMVLCFVEFTDANRALTAMEALQGYKFDNKKPDSSSLRIHFAHFPFKLPSDDDARVSSQPPPGGARFPSQQLPNGARYSSQLLPDSAGYPSKLPHDSAHISSQKPPSSYYSSSQLPPDSAVFPSQQPSTSAHVPSQLPHNSAHSPYRLPSHREEQDVAVIRRIELMN
ncbi:RNA-binding protein 1-like isoform X2 [Bidens hawaiensis]|uniref:RNA-binding protein 1-like isoform X2 n=1 Tax=Bidens hawaiensis TaxID=980011 RepID=UPI00404AD44E